MKKTVTLYNPWTNQAVVEMTWNDILLWADANVHPDDIDEWVKIAHEAFDNCNGEELGRMILGS